MYKECVYDASERESLRRTMLDDSGLRKVGEWCGWGRSGGRQLRLWWGVLRCR